ncbi:hypothetical protein F4778DRAFT_787440 [Xylariomycetidae sp. FL2044]|nr:hypothetical protein F4778DRAFT_787440 [Xylariomycetidae sp. FL2044]
MTKELHNQVEKGPCLGHDNIEADVLAALWEHAPFPRLPPDAPPELKDLVVNIRDPKRVYGVYRASRRYNFQLLVEKFVVQLRYGCGHHACSTSSCFSCRKRLANKSPIRRYSPTSARTLAIHLASQDNPEGRLCPHLQPPSQPSDATKPLVFNSKYPPSSSEARFKKQHLVKRASISKVDHAYAKDSRVDGDRKNQGGHKTAEVEPSPSRTSRQLYITEHSTSKDYRSFAANVFGTVAFKMLEWLSPNSMQLLKEKARAVQDPHTTDQASSAESDSPGKEEQDDGNLYAPSTMSPKRPKHRRRKSRDLVDGNSPPREPTPGNEHGHDSSMRDGIQSESPISNGHSRHAAKNSRARIRTPSLSTSQNKVAVDSNGVEDPGIKSPTFRGHQPDMLSRVFVRKPHSKASFPESNSVNLEVEPSLTIALPSSGRDPLVLDMHRQVEGVDAEEASTTGDSPSVLTPNESDGLQASQQDPEEASELDVYRPQSLSSLNVQAINFICDVLQEDATAERHLFEPQAIVGPSKRLSKQLKIWKRKRKSANQYPQQLRLEWRLFAEQSIFNVLSDPEALLASFTDHDGMIDSQTLWFCMLRLTRVAPSLVFDSLWMALASLFAPPKPLQSSRSPTAKLFPKTSEATTNVEAAAIMSICFHVLIAAAPLVTDFRQLNDMSRIRSLGTTIAGGGSVARQPASLCLQYEDAFTNDMALRLARRLLTVIPARRHFDDLMRVDMDSEDDEDEAENDVVDIMLAQLESPIQPQLNFSPAAKRMHEKRVPILLLDWARAVMLHEWEGRPDVSGDGPFGGALSLIEAMYRKRQSLLLADVHFRCEYLGDRLDAISMPVSWLSFTSTKQNIHLLDFPFIFNPSSLVSYFRAINFARMNRSYEESSSLQSRIKAIIATDSLVTESHQKNVLQDLLKTPSSKYLILDIGRGSVLTDAFDQLWRREERELMRPLKIHLGEDSGEEGFDSGGVQQEFFRLAIAEALDPDYGAFTVDTRTRMTWFQPGSSQPEWKYELIGLLMSLAVYNGLTLPVTFPKALYMKLLGEPVVELHHIADGFPEIANGLTKLLEWNENDGPVEDVFVVTYEFSASMYGQNITRKMEPTSSSSSSQAPASSWPQFSSRLDELAAENADEDAPLVTGDNRNAYVSDYIRYLTNVTVAPQFDALARGFRRCLHPKSLRLLTPTLLQSVVEGTQEIDIAELRRAARYVGWDASHRAVRDFWAVVKRYDDRMKRKLLEFVTASDRVPVGGVANVQFVVQKNGEEEGEGGHLPTAYTCYGTLLLPEYRDREVLRERLGMALENAQGFGFA